MKLRIAKGQLRSALLSLSLPLFACGLYAQSGTGSKPLTGDAVTHGNPHLETLTWTKPEKYDTGWKSAVAMLQTGLIVEVHQSESLSNSVIWYHIGKLDPEKGTVKWGESRSLIPSGDWPSVAVTEEGYVIVTYSDGFYNCCSKLRYIVGTVSPGGDQNQTITFKTNSKGTEFDTGFHDSVSVNNLGVIVEAHQSGQGGDGIFTRVGHLTDPGAGNFTITWSGNGGDWYDKGVDPKISVNDNNDVVEVHRINGSEAKLHYARGKVLFDRQVSFESDHPRLDSEGGGGSVVLLNNSSIIEVNHRSSKGIVYRTGTLSGQHAISWSEPQEIDGTKDHYYPAITADATDTVLTFHSGEEGIFRSVYLRYSTAKLP